jgi:hypothetical protein
LAAGQATQYEGKDHPHIFISQTKLFVKSFVEISPVFQSPPKYIKNILNIRLLGETSLAIGEAG